VRAEREASRAVAAEARKREQSEKASAKERERAEKAATKTTETEAKNRTKAEEKAAREVEAIAKRSAAAREKSERQFTRAMKAQERQRTADARAAARERENLVSGAGQVASSLAHAGAQYVGAAHGEIQGARVTRAALQTQVMNAVSQVGVTDIGEINALTDRVMAQAGQHGMNPQAIADAIGAAQTEFSSLGPMNAGSSTSRRGVFDRAIGTAVQGRNLGADPAEFSRLMGMLQQRGLNDSDREQLARWTVGAEQAGAVSQGSITREAMGPMIQRMSAANSALGPNATPEERSQAMAAAYRQAFSEMQVLKGAGESVRAGGTSMANYERALSNNGVIGRMRTNIAHVGDRDLRGRLQSALFNRQGGLNEGLNNPLMFQAAVMNAGLTDPTAIANLFAGTGRGNAMSLRAPIRQASMALAAPDANGRTGLQNADAMKGVETALTPERVRDLANMHENSDEANLQREAVAREAALRRPGFQRTASDVGARAVANNPLGVLGISALTTGAPGVFAGIGKMMGLTGGTGVGAGAGLLAQVMGTAANMRGVFTGRGADGRELSMRERMIRGAGLVSAPMMMATGPMGLLAGAAHMALPGLMDLGRGALGAGANAVKGTGLAELLIAQLPARIGNEVARALRDSPLTVSAHDAVHAATTAATGRNPTPPTNR